MGLHFLVFWPCGPLFPFILAFFGSASGVLHTSCQKWTVCPTSLQWIYQRRDRLHFEVFSLLGLHFLAFWPCGPSFPCILAFWAFISLHFGLVGLHFLAFWPCGPSFPCILAFSGSASGPPPTSCQKLPVCPTSLQWIYHRDRLHFAVFNLAFLALWAFISLHFGLVGLHFLAFWPCGPSFPCILALWAKNSLHFGLVGLHFLVFLALWAFISLHFGLVGLHFLAFRPCGPLFPCILALWAFISLHFWPCGPFRLFRGELLESPPQVAKNGPFAQRPYNGFLSAVIGSILQFLAFWAFISLYFGIVGLHFLAFWPCGPSFPCISALWAFISLHFGLVGLHFLSFWLCGPSFPCILACWTLGREAGTLDLAFWPCGPSFPCILAVWAFISLHFGLVGLHFLAFWPCGPSFPCILALCAFISLHFGSFGVSFWGPPHRLPEMARLPNVLTMDLSAP